MNNMIVITAVVLACMSGTGSAQGGGRPRIIVIRRPSPTRSSGSNTAAVQNPTSASSAPSTSTTKAASPSSKVTSGYHDASQGYDHERMYHNLMLAEHLDVPYSRDPTRHYLSNKLDIPYILLANRGNSGGYDHVNYLISQKLDVPYLPTLSNGKRGGADPLRTAYIMDSLDAPIIYGL